MFEDALNLLLDTHPQVQECAFGSVTFRALIGDNTSPVGPEPRGTKDEEHDLRLTCLASEIGDSLPEPGDIITIEGINHPVSVVSRVPGAPDLTIVCRQPESA